jgi:hypothetical protein
MGTMNVNLHKQIAMGDKKAEKAASGNYPSSNATKPQNKKSGGPVKKKQK